MDKIKEKWRILLKWGFLSPALKAATGHIFITKNDHLVDDNIEYKIRVKLKVGKVSYAALKPEEKFPMEWDEIRDTVDAMVLSYFAGLCLNKKVYYWLDNVSLTHQDNKTLKEDERTWAKT